MAFFKQCQMRKITPGGASVQSLHTAWIPEEFAHVGKMIDILGVDGEWDRGWEIIAVFTRMSEEYVREHENDHKHQAEASDKFTENKGLGLKR